jgi:hypothetical protein
MTIADGDWINCLLIHGTFANTRSNGDVGWWQPGSEFCGKMDALLRKERAAARCWADKTTFAWTGKNSELARHEAGRALAAQLANLEEDKMIERYHLSSTYGSGETGSLKKATTPAAARPNVSRVVATGRRMKGVDGSMA